MNTHAEMGRRWHRTDAEGRGGRGGYCAVVSRWTGIPVAKMLEGEMQKLVQMEERLRERVVGQDEA